MDVDSSGRQVAPMPRRDEPWSRKRESVVAEMDNLALVRITSPRTFPLCVACERLRPAIGGRLTCVAFPDGIPDRLLKGLADHRRPYPGDHGIRFELDQAAPEEVRSRISSMPIGVDDAVAL